MLANENPLRINDKEQEEETIAAIATPPGTGGVAIIRISGSKVPKLIPKLVTHRLKPRQATFTSFIDEQGITLDQGIAIYFPAPNSFTGEDILELHGHGGAIITDLLLERVLNEKVRIAHPGEFSERAFLNNKIDLAQAEAIADLIHASSRQAARSAMRSLTGEFSQTIDQINHFIIQARMYIEAAIDFSDEEISFLDDRTIQEKLMHILQLLRMVHQTAKQGSILCEGITVVLIGEPNVGKSSLMNHLSGENIAIVTNVPGTTRDILKQQITLDGIPIKIIDTAGLRESPDIIEQEGIKRAQQEMQRADIILYLEDVSLNAGTTLHPLFAPNDCPVIHIKNKIDLIGKEPSIEISSKNQAIIWCK
ncbi:MAG: tRNA uridine-5-carboxymethylaminomethyl(34) synthesis GTPase MnmE [Gammaproteobacteria bacterium]|nr:tRNA uridine-5-carboxymethylaminomethyl(34) synthesis GTPase MnmE [Gammaproteobacteria bacterium]